MLKSYVTPDEARLLDLAVYIKFGEISDVDLLAKNRDVCRELTPGQERFLALIRAEQIAHLDRIVVHEGDPATIELNGNRHGFSYRIKRKV